MHVNEVYALIRFVIAQKLLVEIECVMPYARLVEDLGADSLNLVEIVLDINAALDIDLPVQGLAKIRRVEDLSILVTEAIQR